MNVKNMSLNLSKPKKHSNNVILALAHFPKGMLILLMGIAFLSSPWLYHIFRQYEINPPVLQIIFTAGIIGTLPFLLLFGITLLRLPLIRRNMKLIAQATYEVTSWDRAELLADQTKEKGKVTSIFIEEKLVIELYETGASNLLLKKTPVPFTDAIE
jgi:hypothetical protein